MRNVFLAGACMLCLSASLHAELSEPAAKAAVVYEPIVATVNVLKQSVGPGPMHALQKVESAPRMRQATFTAAAGSLDIQGWCRRSGTSVICQLMITNNDVTQNVHLAGDAKFYDRTSQVYISSKVGLAGTEQGGWTGITAKLLHGLPANGLLRFDKVPEDISEIYRLEFTVNSENGPESKVAIESVIPIAG